MCRGIIFYQLISVLNKVCCFALFPPRQINIDYKWLHSIMVKCGVIKMKSGLCPRTDK